MKALGICLLFAGMLLNTQKEDSSSPDQVSALVTTKENVSQVQWFPAAGSCMMVSGLVLVLSGRSRKGMFPG